MLEAHADLGPDPVDVLDVGRQLRALDDDPAGLVVLQRVDAPDERGLARPRRPADDDPLAEPHQRDRLVANHPARGNGVPAVADAEIDERAHRVMIC